MFFFLSLQIVPIYPMNLSARIVIWIVCIVAEVELVFRNLLDVMGNLTAQMV